MGINAEQQLHLAVCFNHLRNAQEVVWVGDMTWRQRGKWLIQTGQEEGQEAGAGHNQGWNGTCGKASTVQVKLNVLGASFLCERMDPPSSK